jgi:hypothetical protein
MARSVSDADCQVGSVPCISPAAAIQLNTIIVRHPTCRAVPLTAVAAQTVVNGQYLLQIISPTEVLI